MINNNSSPTEQTCHVHIRYFSFQDWREDRDIIMVHIPDIVNPFDSLSKLFGFVLYSQHYCQVMGHYYPP